VGRVEQRPAHCERDGKGERRIGNRDVVVDVDQEQQGNGQQVGIGSGARRVARSAGGPGIVLRAHEGGPRTDDPRVRWRHRGGLRPCHCWRQGMADAGIGC